MRALVAGLMLLLIVPLAPGAAADPTLVVGTVSYQYPDCSVPDIFRMVAREISEDEWVFVFIDVGHVEQGGACVWAEPGVLNATGSPQTGFTGGVESGAWQIESNTFSAVLTMRLALGTLISAEAHGTHYPY